MQLWQSRLYGTLEIFALPVRMRAGHRIAECGAQAKMWEDGVLIIAVWAVSASWFVLAASVSALGHSLR
eukprot:3582611-Amphidinium_carterae.2